MKALLATTCILTGALLAGGCATKKYVRNTTAPIQAKVDQVGDQTTQNGQQIQDTRGQLKQVDERAQTGISAANEKADAASGKADAAGQRADAAQTSANGAMTKAGEADQKADQSLQGLNGLRQTVANLDDYKLQTSVAVAFKFDQAVLTADGQSQLDKLATDVQTDKRFFIAVEGYTDATGSKAYNEALSRKRADSVVTYLVAKHDVPIYRIHMIGLGQEKPVEEAKTREARAKNRRVEVKVFSADQAASSVGDSAANISH